MTDYTDAQVAVIQKFVDAYRFAPEILTISDRFVGGLPLTKEEFADLGALVH